MNLDETKKYLDHRLSGLGWAVHIDKAGYEKIHEHTRGAEERLNQLYYKLVSLGAQRPKREINEEVLKVAIDDLARTATLLERAHEKTAVHNNLDNDRLSIEQLAMELDAVASKLKVDRKATATGAVAKARGNGAEAKSRQAAATALPTLLMVAEAPTVRAAVTKAVGNNFSIVQAADGEEAWTLLSTNNDVKLVVTDLVMPKLDGFDLIRRIRSDQASPRLAFLPIIVVTAMEDTNAEIRALVAGADDFISNFTDTAELQAHVLARYKLAQTAKHTQGMKGAEWRRVSGEKTSPAMSTHPANTSQSRFGTPATNVSKPPAQPVAPVSPPPHGVAIGSKPETGRPPEQHPAARGLDHAVTPGRDRPVLGKVDQAGSRASKMEARRNSTLAITLTATMLVAVIIAGIAHFERSKITIAEKPVASAHTNAPAPAERVAGDRQQPLSTPGAASEMSKPPNSASLTGALPKTTPRAEAKGDSTAPREEDPTINAGQDGSPDTAMSSQPDNSAIAAGSAEPVHKTEPPGRPAAVARAKSSVTEAPSSKKALPRPEKRNAGQHSPKAAATARATTPAARTQPMPALADLPQQSDADDASVALADRNTADSRGGTSASATPPSSITQAELAALLKKFVFVYQAGDIDQFLNLFADDVRTNDQTSKAGLREDYEQLFRTTNMRQMILGNVTWELDNNRAHGWGNFEVKVRKTGAPETKTYNGSLMFNVEKHNGRLLIKKLYYGQWRAAAG